MNARTLIGVVLAGSAVALPAAARDDTPAAPKLPTEQHQQLNRLVGFWDVATRFKAGPDQFREGTATCETRWVLDGHVLRQQYNSTVNGQPFTVLQLLGYDTGKKKFFEIKFDNMDTGVLHNEGTISADGKVLTLTGERIDPRTGAAAKIRSVTTVTDANHYTLEWFLAGADGKEEKIVTLTHTRKKP